VYHLEYAYCLAWTIALHRYLLADRWAALVEDYDLDPGHAVDFHSRQTGGLLGSRQY
jgi:hypothetical protein